MPLSFAKLERILNEKGLLAKKIFTIDSTIVYIEVIIIDTADSFMLYIPSKYDIEPNSRSNNIYKMSYIDITDNGYVSSDYIDEPDKLVLEKQYNDSDINFSNSIDKNLAQKLENNYNYPLELKDAHEKNVKQLQEIFRQLRRLKLCVQGLQYKLCIFFNNYLCCIRRDNTFEAFTIQRYQGGPEKKLIVTIDLEAFYDKAESIATDVKTVREGIYFVLYKNQNKHIKNLHRILSQKSNLSLFSEKVTKKKERYSAYLEKMEKLLNDIGVAEKKNISKLDELRDFSRGETSIRDIYADIDKTHKIKEIETELSRIHSIKQELMHNIINVKVKYEDLSLKVDQICFDNTVMIDAIINNFIALSEL